MANEAAIDAKPGPWMAAGGLARWLLGAFSLVGGLTWALFTVHGPTAAVDLTVGVVLAAAGLVLLMPHRIRLPRRLTALAMSGFAVAGTAAGLVALTVRTVRTGSAYVYVEDRGWPFAWAQRGGIADDPATGQRLARAASWAVDAVSLATDALLWAYAGMLVVVITVLVRRRRP